MEEVCSTQYTCVGFEKKIHLEKEVLHTYKNIDSQDFLQQWQPHVSHSARECNVPQLCISQSSFLFDFQNQLWQACFCVGLLGTYWGMARSAHCPIFYVCVVSCRCPMLSNAPNFHMSETDVSRSPWCSYCDGRLKAGFVAMSLSLPAFQMRKLLLLDLYILLLDIISLSDLLNKTQGLVWISRKKNKQEVHIWKP